MEYFYTYKFKPMINDFIVRAYPEENRMRVILNGVFMKSEIELALHLARTEAIKLKPQFEVVVDIQNLKFAYKNYDLSLSQMKKMLKLLGAGTMHIMDLNSTQIGREKVYVGFYPYENEWFFS